MRNKNLLLAFAQSMFALVLFASVTNAQTVTPSKPQTPEPAAVPASNGTNPAELITRVEVKYQYQNFAGGDLRAIIRGETRKLQTREASDTYFDSGSCQFV